MIQFCTVNLVAGCGKYWLFVDFAIYVISSLIGLSSWISSWVSMSKRYCLFLVQSNILLSLESRNEAVSGSPLLLLSLLAKSQTSSNLSCKELYLNRWPVFPISQTTPAVSVCKVFKLGKSSIVFRWLLSYSVCIVFRCTCLFLREWETTYSPFYLFV